MTLQYNPGPVGPPPATNVGTIQIGRDSSGNFALSAAGLAVRRPDGSYVALDSDEGALVDVTPLVMVGVDPCVLRIPVPADAVRRGDLVVASDDPFSPLFVLERVFDALPNQIMALDPMAGQLVTFVPPANLVFDVFVVAASLYDIFASGDD